jgi:hypothetical protein
MAALLLLSFHHLSVVELSVAPFGLTTFLPCASGNDLFLSPANSAVRGSALPCLQLTIVITRASVAIVFDGHYESVIKTSVAPFGLTTFLPCVAMTFFFRQLV